MSTVFDSRLNEIVKLYHDRVYPHVNGVRGSWRFIHETSKLAANLPFETDDVGQFSHHLITEREMLRAFIETVAEDDVVADVGGYRGLYGFLAASQGARSHIFEMTEENYGEILNTQSLNPDLDVVVEKKAVWSKDTTVETPEKGTGQSKVGQGESKVDAVSLDSYFEGRQFPDVVKIDVEGAEGHVLEGAEKLLEEKHPTLFIEFHFEGVMQNFGYSFFQLKSILKDHGYKLTVLSDRTSEKLVFAR